MCTPNQKNFFINQIEMQPAFIDSQIFVIQVYVIYVSMPILCKYAVFIDNCFPSALPGNFSAPPPLPIEKGMAYCYAAVGLSVGRLVHP